MTPEEQQKASDRLAKAIELAYNSPGRMFWRGLLWGIGRGIGNVIGFLLLIAVLYYLIKISGLDRTFGQILKSFDDISQAVKNLPR